MSQPNKPEPTPAGDVVIGILLGLAGLILPYLVLFAFSFIFEYLSDFFDTGLPAVLLWFLSGVAYYAVAITLVVRKQRKGILIGLIIGAVLYGLLATTCFTLFFSFV